MTLDQIRESLADRRVSVVAEFTGIHANTISRIRSGKNKNPTIRVVTLLEIYLSDNKSQDQDQDHG